jgi:drug/metabolite transporter (DMT)-like permease
MQARKNTWLATYILLGILWGSSFLFIHEGLTILTPIGVVFWRLLSGAIVLAVIVRVRGIKITRNPRHWLLIGFGGLFMNSIPFTLFAYGQQHVTSILASIINATTPIMTLLALLTLFRSEKLSPHVIWGLLVGASGVMVVLAVWQGFGENDPIAILCLLGAPVCYGIGGPFIVRYVSPLKLPNEQVAFVQMIIAAIAVTPFYLSGPLMTAPLTWAPVASVLALGAIGSGFAYVLFYRVINQAGSAIANSVTYITPLVAVLLGVLLLGEPVYWYEPVGAVVVVLGALISQGRLPAMVAWFKAIGSKS